MVELSRASRRRFGARNRMSVSRDPHDAGGRLQGERSETLQFQLVASGISGFHRPGRREDWTDDGRDFDFSDRSSALDSDRQEQRPAVDRARTATGPPKYASGQRVSTPGASLNAALAPSVATSEGHLKQNWIPPKKQDAFLGNIAAKSAAAKRPGGARRVLVGKARSAASSALEAASAPSPPLPTRPTSVRSPRQDKPLGRSGWTNTRKAPEGPVRQAQPRVSLSESSAARRQRRQQEEEEEEKEPDVTLRRSSRHFSGSLASRRLSELAPKNREVTFSLASRGGQRGSGVATRGRSKVPVVGASADQPIALDDSDSDVEVEDSPAATSPHSQEVDAGQTSDTSTLDLNELGATCVARVDDCDVLFGLFQCTASLMFQNDRVCICKIRGNHERWPFQDIYVLKFGSLVDARVCWESDTDEGKEDSPSFIPAGDELPFIALRCPPPEAAKEAAWRSFFDPSDSCDDISKKHIIFKPTDATNAKESVSTIVEVVRSFIAVEPIEKSESRRYLCALEGEPFSFAKAMRPKASRKRKKPGADGTTADSDDDSDGDDVVLTYPPPPCASDIVTLIHRDVNRLKPERYLNDNLIDYYFKRLMLDTFRDEPAVQQRVLFLSSHFYSRFRMGRGANVASRLEAGYKNVSKWLARADFFSRSVIFIPINKDWHWSLAVILNPRCAGVEAQEGEDEENPCSCIAVLDPLGGYHNRKIIVRNLKVFLRLEWQNSQRGADEDAAEPPPYDIDRVRAVGVNAPRQDNGYDCGVYVLKYAEVILRSCLALGLLEQPGGAVDREVVDGDLAALLPRDAFAQEDVDEARRIVRSCIETDIDARRKAGAVEKRPLESE